MSDLVGTQIVGFLTHMLILYITYRSTGETYLYRNSSVTKLQDFPQFGVPAHNFPFPTDLGNSKQCVGVEKCENVAQSLSTSADDLST